MPDLVDEVDEEIRQERAALLARRFGGVFAALAMFVLAAVGGWQGWQWYENRNAAAAAEAFLAATRDAAAEGADTAAVARKPSRTTGPTTGVLTNKPPKNSPHSPPQAAPRVPQNLIRSPIL